MGRFIVENADVKGHHAYLFETHIGDIYDCFPEVNNAHGGHTITVNNGQEVVGHLPIGFADHICIHFTTDSNMAGGSCMSSSDFIILLMFVTASLIYSTDDVHAHNVESTKVWLSLMYFHSKDEKRCEWILKSKNLSQASQISIPVARSGRGKQYTLSRIPYSANCCCWYQLERQLIASRDVELNPGPNTNISGSEQSQRVVNQTKI